MEAVRTLAEYAREPDHRATVIATDRITPAESPDEVRELVLEVDREDLPYQVGQSIGVRAPGRADLGQAEHYRLYSVADLPTVGPDGKPRIRICVRRCTFIDEFSGEEVRGVASNYLCDLRIGDRLTVTGPHGLPFEVPKNPYANLILIGTGTGIAPFRALVKYLYSEGSGFEGKVRLLYGARSGLELLYMNDERDDLVQYYDRETFEAFHALSPRPNWSDPIAWDDAIGARADELLEMLREPDTYVYVAGLEGVRDTLDRVFASLMGGADVWQRRKAELMAGGRWVELLY